MSDPRRHRALRGLIRLSDILSTSLAMVLAYHLQESLVGTIPGLRAATEIWMFVLALYIALPVWVALLTWQRLDRILEAPLSALRLTAELARVHAFGGALVLAVLWLAQIDLNRSVFGSRKARSSSSRGRGTSDRSVVSSLDRLASAACS